jgi:hypothetical protein
MMTDPKRLSDDQDLAHVFQAAATDLPDSARQEKMLRALEGAAGLAGLSLAAAGATKAAKASVLSWAYWLSFKGALLVSGVLSVSAVSYAITSYARPSHAIAPPASAPPTVPLAKREQRENVASSLPSAAPESLTAVEIVTTAPLAQAPFLPPSASARPPETVPERTEVQTLDAARAALASQPAQALALCNEHSRRFPKGMLGEERERIAIEALVGLGRKSEAKARADRFLQVFPNSTYKKRIDRLTSEP